MSSWRNNTIAIAVTNVPFRSLTALPKDSTVLLRDSTVLLRDSTVPHKDNITARPKANLPCNTNRHLLNRAVERRAAAAVAWLVAWPLSAVAALLKKDVNAGK
jgi:hypothetical protein